jgi:CPA1 family monovalent cation:H+ antiporter
MFLEEQIILLLVAAAAVAMLAGRLRLPYTVALVLAGLALGLLDLQMDLHLSKELVFAIFLPALLYEAAFHLDVERFRRNSGPILVLAVVGVVLSMLITGGFTYLAVSYFLDASVLSLLLALLFGSLISATDPVSVLAIFKKLGLPRRLNLIVEGESLFNDGTAVVVFSLILAAVTGYDAHGVLVGQIGPAWVAGAFLREVLGGLAVGLVTGMTLSYLTSRIEDHLLEIMLTTILAYGTYLLAEHLHVSGVIGVVAAGMMSGNYGSKVGMSPTTRVAVVTFWEYVAFVVNSLIFLLIGMEVKIDVLWNYRWHILLAWLAVLLARAIVINCLLPLINSWFKPLPWRWSPVMIWGGLRGSLSMALALSLPRDLPGREMILAMTFGVVIISILGQGLTMRPLLRVLGMLGKGRRHDYEELQARLKACLAAIEELDQLKHSRALSRAVYAKMVKFYKTRLARFEKQVVAVHAEDKRLGAAETLSVRRHLLATEKEEMRRAFQAGDISGANMKRLVGEIDAEIDSLDRE